MAVPTFIVNSRVGRAVLQIHPEHLEIAGLGWDKDARQTLSLRSIDPSYVRQSVRLYQLITIPLFFSLVGGLTIWALLPLAFATVGLIISAGVFTAWFLIQALRGIAPVEYYAFRNHWHRVLFRIVREKAQASECDAFVAELVLRIRAASGELSPEESTALLRRAGPYDIHASTPRLHRQDKWLAAMIAGALAAGLPLVPPVAAHEFSLFLIFSLSLGSFVFGTLSFQTKERFRWLSLAGMMLSLVPPLFYI